MISWKRGHTCQQHSTTTQPSRPSKARPVQRLQLFLHCCPGGALWFTKLGFYSSRIWLYDCGGRRHHRNCPAFPKLHAAQNTNTCSVFILYVPSVFFFCLVLSRVCVMFTSLNLKPVFLQRGGLTLLHRTVTEQGLRLVFTTSVKNRKKSGKAKLTSSDASERVKEMQCLLLHYI